MAYQISSDTAIIIGGGHAGGTVAANLRQSGWQGPITIVGEEPYPPYQRPPLSKEWLLDDENLDKLYLRGESFYRKNDIELRLGVSALAIERTERCVSLSDGVHLCYDVLVVATGAYPRALEVPGATAGNIFALRDVRDAGLIKTVLSPGRNLAIVGGGYIGLEIAAAAVKRGTHATIFEQEARLLARVASPELSGYFHAAHSRMGVEIVVEAAVVGFATTDGGVCGLQLGDGRRFACDAAVVGIGAVPRDTLAREAGLECANGILVDTHSRTSDARIYAIGDCTRRPVRDVSLPLRLESVPSALEQAKQAAADICGKPEPAAEVPWFWSTQHDLKLKIAGIVSPGLRRIVRSDGEGAAYSVFHLDDKNRLKAVEAVNAPADFTIGRQLIASGSPLAPEWIADASVPIQKALRA